MAATSRPRRSMLYMPGSNPRALEKARSLKADALILDLEDAVSPDAKADARAGVAAAVKAGGYGGREVIVRVNGLDTPWGFADIAAIAPLNPDGILLPKVDSAAALRAAEKIMIEAGASDKVALWAMMETPRAMLRAEEIAGATPRLAGFVMGTSDLANDLCAHHTPLRLPLLTSLGLCLLAARAERLAVLDGVFLDLNDDDGYRASCRQGVELGFDGKTLIHPRQIDAANDAFAPSAAEIDMSRRIITAFDAARRDGKGVVLVDGRLVENLHVNNAKRLVAMAEAIARLDAAE